MTLIYTLESYWLVLLLTFGAKIQMLENFCPVLDKNLGICGGDFFQVFKKN